MIEKVLFLFLFLSWAVWGEEDLFLLSQQAENLGSAHDYAAAGQLYEQLNPDSLPAWQRARLFYNLGTLRLAQQRPDEALMFFQKIHPTELSLPRFGCDYFLNLGIAYLHYAQTWKIPFLNQQTLFIQQALEAFHKAYLMECQSHPLIEQWIQTANLQLHVNEQQKRQYAIEQADQGKEFLSVGVLRQALEQADQALQLSLLKKLGELDTSSHLMEQQQAVLTAAAPFIPTVLEEQKLHFQQAKNLSAACQQVLWEKIIPLFDQGLKAAQNADKQLKQKEANSQLIMDQQKQTLKNWQQAFVFLTQPPQLLQKDVSTAPQNLTETFRLIQEMYLQDQSPREQKQQELHTW